MTTQAGPISGDSKLRYPGFWGPGTAPATISRIIPKISAISELAFRAGHLNEFFGRQEASGNFRVRPPTGPDPCRRQEFPGLSGGPRSFIRSLGPASKQERKFPGPPRACTGPAPKSVRFATKFRQLLFCLPLFGQVVPSYNSSFPFQTSSMASLSLVAS